ncbi:N-acetylgalactosamine 6-sulfate sulfatase [Coraliomargarita sinensis]|uniref:N-acetylgalactosamine 6-sulfate sulfatase n=1 Tax=Coraliomargarita sinensis TaxID=2174842 RepID=A0A317ZEM0_9BACT|nr:sulfatase-like hydrolase/transferase [Coraliomargarita sinensis]PXA03212.1 N-acetylgalactosamine 6-sulfate sulfatase [Coraliomargarita sinensis]
MQASVISKYAGIALLLCSGAISAFSLPQSSPPNVILCMTDDQGWGDTAYNGHPVLRTPHLDRMAAEGLRFDRFYSAAPVCSPTRGSALTGRHPYRYGIFYANVGSMKAEEMTLAEILKRNGYATGHFGKWHLGTLTTKIKDSNRGGPDNLDEYSPPWENGFDSCFSTEAKVPTYWKEGDYEKYGTRYWTGPGEMVPPTEISGDDSKLIMDRALPFIRKQSEAGIPFFTVIWFHTPHLPVVSAPPYTDGYEEHGDYYGCLTAMDEQMGRLRAELESLGVSKNTMLWFCSDNGPEGNDSDPGRTGGLRGRKRSLYEGGVRVPGLLVWPAMIKEARRVDFPANTSDYFPTILDALGYRMPEALARPYDGVSLLPLIRAKVTQRPSPMAFESRQQLSLTGNRYKVYSKDGGKTYALYDLIFDPAETTDISEKQPEVLEQMIHDLQTWQASCAASNRGEDY